MSDSPSEYDLIQKIQNARSADDRSRLIAELENLPVMAYPFYRRWMRIYDVEEARNCWTDGEYDSSLSRWPRDIQLLIAMELGEPVIGNGGFLHFFENITGEMAPEMAEWCNRIGLQKTADIIRKAMSVFGLPFPRSEAKRRELLSKIIGQPIDEPIEQPIEEWDPFYAMDEVFYESCGRNIFTSAADRWLREVCGIHNLSQLPPGMVIDAPVGPSSDAQSE